MSLARASALVVVALAVATAAPVGASDAEDEAASTELFNAGRDLMKRGDYAAACPKLAESARLRPTVGALAKLAECEAHEKRLVSAYTRWQQALNLARSRRDERIPDVEREVARMEGIVPKLRITVAHALPDDAEIRVDEVALGPAGAGVPLAVEPGRHTVRASAPHKQTWSMTVDTAADGATTTVSIPDLEDAPAAGTTVEAPAAAAPVAPLLASTPPVVVAPANPWRTAGVLVAGAGLAAVATGGAFGLDALRRRDEAHCSGTVCGDAASASTLQGAKSSADWSTALVVSGAIVVAGGTLLWLFAHDARTSMRVGAGPTLGGAVVVGTWQTN
jgi:hypothetical protein